MCAVPSRIDHPSTYTRGGCNCASGGWRDRGRQAEGHPHVANVESARERDGRSRCWVYPLSSVVALCACLLTCLLTCQLNVSSVCFSSGVQDLVCPTPHNTDGAHSQTCTCNMYAFLRPRAFCGWRRSHTAVFHAMHTALTSLDRVVSLEVVAQYIGKSAPAPRVRVSGAWCCRTPPHRGSGAEGQHHPMASRDAWSHACSGHGAL